jgi:serine protease Do
LTQAESTKLGTSGAYVVSVTPNSAAEAAGLLPRDVISDFDRKPIGDVHDLVCALFESKPGDIVELTVLRGGQSRSVTVTLGRWPNGSAQMFYQTACDVVLRGTKRLASLS